MSDSNNHNPMEHFQSWFYEVEHAHPEQETNAMILSTIGIDNFPKNRIVLLKRFTWEGFIFFTNYNSEKGKAIAHNNKVGITFNWSASNRKVHIRGHAEKLAKNLSEGYFDTRPRGSQLGAWASQQSDVAPSREYLENQLKYYETKFENQTIPKPPHWGGYIIKPNFMAFIEYDPLTTFNSTTAYELLPNYNWTKEVRCIGV